MCVSWCEAEPAAAPAVRAGQFFMVRGWEDEPLLFRPMSVFDWRRVGPASGEPSPTAIEAEFLCAVRGRGTELLGQLPPGAPILLVGPLGNGWPLEAVTGGCRVALVGGGCGAAPLYLAAQRLAVRPAGVVEIDAYLGFRGVPYGDVCDRIAAAVSRLIVTSESPDGSWRAMGRAAETIPGRITDAFDPAGYDTVLACGPRPMLAEIGRRCRRQGTTVFVSLEERMACGVGACLGCAVKTRSGMKHVCKDGPIFRGDEVIWDG